MLVATIFLSVRLLILSMSVRPRALCATQVTALGCSSLPRLSSMIQTPTVMFLALEPRPGFLN